MINASDAFEQKIENGFPVVEEVQITFANGVIKTVRDEILNADNEIVDGVDGNSFPIGNTVCKTCGLALDNSEEQWKDYDFYGARLKVRLKMTLDDGTVETINKGTYTVTVPEEYGEDVELTALDDMYKANKTYTTNLQFPQTAFSVLRDACQTCGISLGVTSMDHGDVQISAVPEGVTFRVVIGCIAMLDSANARIDTDGYLQFIKWDFSDIEDTDNAAVVNSDGFVTFDGGSNSDSEDYVIPAGTWVIDSAGYLHLQGKKTESIDAELREYISSPTLSTDDIVITGIRVKSGDASYLYGKTGYVLELENTLLQSDQLQTVASWIGDNLIGIRFRSMEGDLLYNPLIEFGDMARTYDRKGNAHITPITYAASPLNGKTTLKTQAESPVRGSSKYYSESTKTVVEARKLVQQEKTARDMALEELKEGLTDGSGMYETQVKQEDGSIISYVHDKPTIEKSKIVIKLTSNAIGVSNDGGQTYPCGFIFNGTLITRILQAEGINADLIDTGALVVKDDKGNIIFQADIDNRTVRISSDCVMIGDRALTEAFEDTENTIAEARNMTMQLSNEYQAVTADADGNVSGTFPSVQTSVIVMYGFKDISAECSYTFSTSNSISGNWDYKNRIYTVTNLTADDGWVDIRATYLQRMSITKRFTVSKLKAGKNGINGLRGLQGEKGEQGIPGKDGVDGKTSHFHVKYSFVPNPTDSSQMTEESATYMGTYVDFTEADSTDPSKYTWRKFEGKDGADGIPGTNGIDGKTYYLHLAYADSADGKTGFSVSDGTGKKYIGQYTDEIKADSTEPSKYKWTLIRGDDARTYEIEMSANILKRGADNVVTPATLTAKAYYRDGAEATRHAYAGRWIVLVSEDGVNYVQIDASTSDAVSKSYAVENLDMKYAYVRFEVYAAGGTSTKLDMQSIPVVIDVEALTREQIIDLLTNKGEWKGLYYLNGHLYISFDAALGGVLTLGGKYNGNGRLIMRRSDGTVFGSTDNDGITFFQSYVEYDTYYEYAGYRLGKDGVKKVEGLKSTVSSKADVMTEDRAVIDFGRLSRNTNMVLIDCSTVTINVPSIGTESAKTVSTTFTKLADADKCVAIYMGISARMLNCCNYSISGNKLTAKFANYDDITDWNGVATFQILQYSYIGTV